MLLTPIELFYETLKNPGTLIYTKERNAYLEDQFVNHVIDLIALLRMMPREGTPQLDLLRGFFFADTEELTSFGSMRALHLANQSTGRYMLSVKRFALLDMVARLDSADDYEKVTRLFIEQPMAAQISRDEYNESLAVLCRILRNQLAIINRTKDMPAQFTTSAPYSSLEMLAKAFISTQKKYGYYHFPVSFDPHGGTAALKARQVAVCASLLSLIALKQAIQGMIDSQIAAPVVYGLVMIGLLYATYRCMDELYKLQTHCDAAHQQFAATTREKLGLPEPELELSELRDESGVEKMVRSMRSFIGRPPETERYQPDDQPLIPIAPSNPSASPV